MWFMNMFKFFCISIITGSFLYLQAAEPINFLATMPEDILREIGNYILDDRLNIPVAIATHDGLFSANKEIRTKKPTGKKQLKQKVELVQKRFNMHPLLAQAFLQKRTDWIKDIHIKIDAATLVPVKDVFLQDTNERVNSIEATLAVLIKDARSIKAVSPTAKAIAIHNYLQNNFSNNIAAHSGTLSTSGALKIFKHSYNSLIIFKNNDYIMFRDTFSAGLAPLGTDESAIFIPHHSSSYYDIDIFEKNSIYLLRRSRMEKKSSLFLLENIGNMRTLFSNEKFLKKTQKGAVREWHFPNKQIQTINEYCFKGTAAFVTYDQEKEAISVFDEEDKLLFSLPEGKK